MEIIFLRQAYKFIRKCNPALKEKIKIEVLKIKENPNVGKTLKGDLKHIKSHRFPYNGTSYRIAYHLKDNIIVISIASRENFYKDLLI